MPAVLLQGDSTVTCIDYSSSQVGLASLDMPPCADRCCHVPCSDACCQMGYSGHSTGICPYAPCIAQSSARHAALQVKFHPSITSITALEAFLKEPRPEWAQVGLLACCSIVQVISPACMAHGHHARIPQPSILHQP
jgi:hypothetical protein